MKKNIVFATALTLIPIAYLVGQQTSVPGIESVDVDGMVIPYNTPIVDYRPWPDQVKVNVHKTGGGVLTITLLPHVSSTYRDWWADLSDFAPEVYLQYMSRPPEKTGDVDRDGVVDTDDISFIKSCISAETPTADCWICDLNRDGKVNLVDVALCKSKIE